MLLMSFRYPIPPVCQSALIIRRAAMPINAGITTQRPRKPPEPYAARPCRTFSYSSEAISLKMLNVTGATMGLRIVEINTYPRLRARLPLEFCAHAVDDPAIGMA